MRIMLGEAMIMIGDSVTTQPRGYVGIGSEVSERLVKDLKREFSKSAPLYEEVVAETGKFLYICTKFPEATFRPSVMVDEGWHAFILRTQDYFDHCNKLGSFVHHNPDEEPVSRELVIGQIQGTYDILESLDLEPHAEVWRAGHWDPRCSSCGN